MAWGSKDDREGMRSLFWLFGGKGRSLSGIRHGKGDRPFCCLGERGDRET